MQTWKIIFLCGRNVKRDEYMESCSSSSPLSTLKGYAFVTGLSNGRAIQERNHPAKVKPANFTPNIMEKSRISLCEIGAGMSSTNPEDKNEMKMLLYDTSTQRISTYKTQLKDSFCREKEEKEERKPLLKNRETETPSSKTGKVTDSPIQNAFVFWAYFTLAVSVVTLGFVFMSSLTPQNDKGWFLSLPNDLRQYYSQGRTIKVQLNPNRPPIEVFAIEEGPRDAEVVVLVHGFGCSSYSFRQVIRSLGSSGIHAVAFDLPGSGFSDKSTLEEDERWGGVLGGLWDIYTDIKEKGLFWGFDQLVETGQIPYEELEIRVSTTRSIKPLSLKSEEMGRVIGQVIDTMGLSPVHLVLHDSALGMGASWSLENSGSVSSLTLLDSASKSISLPLWVLEMPVLRESVLGCSSTFARFLRLCCSRSIETSVAEAHRVLLKGRDGRRAVVGVGKGLNYSFSLEEWAGSESMKGIPLQVLWSSNWSEAWSKEGRQVAEAVPQAIFLSHSGGRWPQEDAADEIAESIVRFVFSLPKSVRQVKEEPLPDHIQKMLDEANDDAHETHHHHHSHGGHGHHHGGHDHAHADYMDAYGLGHGWES
ncbi:protein AUXIN RESPONSE 4-like [Telopea speciosissima]|uniref:protein AUXIN RESPONSE 4-like n=1 Tax=Telopea speciosissima TaxID=54955 RepID=UPI001CC3F21C|nr:protein AUXIN RESPONSE 4-like [Telopea speciosissima]